MSSPRATAMVKQARAHGLNVTAETCPQYLFLTDEMLAEHGPFAKCNPALRSQATVDQVSYMKAMIPHHSIAIMTSTRASISDPRVRKLADGIIDSQRREIGEMKALISELQDAQ